MPPCAFILLFHEPAYRAPFNWLVGIALVVPVLAWFCFRSKGWMRGVGFVLVGVSTIFASCCVIAAFNSDEFLGPSGPDYAFVGIAFAAAALPLVVARVAASWAKQPRRLR